ncbi:hypothetical protein HY991_01225 [Candidatus Micrarchaeota archaeon]|nr:hypothetical protein [Candidatus Micrarchaeota archaeon]
MRFIYLCNNCRHQFEAETEAAICPRCSSKRTSRHAVIRREESPQQASNVRAHTPLIYREGKPGWKQFHSTELKTCLECGGSEFDFDRRKNEKTCRKCGNVVRVARPTQ